MLRVLKSQRQYVKNSPAKLLARTFSDAQRTPYPYFIEPSGIIDTTNRLLLSLPEATRSALRSFLRRVDLELGTVISDMGKAVRRVYFPESCIISLVVPLEDGMMVETAMIGLDGAYNVSSALDGNETLNKSIGAGY